MSFTTPTTTSQTSSPPTRPPATAASRILGRRRPPTPSDTAVGVLALIAAAGLWGLVIIGPDLLPHTSTSAIVGGRFVVLGLVAAIASRGRLRGRDWPRAFRYAFAGFVGYYALLVVGIRFAGAAPAAVVMGLTPVAYALIGARSERLDLRALAAPLTIVTAGLLLVHAVDLGSVGAASVGGMLVGLLITAASVALWMWYGVDNGRHLRTGAVDSRAWTTTVGIAAGVMSAPIFGHAVLTDGIGPDVGRFAVVVVVLGVGSAWLGTMAWNVAARLLPESLVGPLLVVELLVALVYAHLVGGHLPALPTTIGYLLLMGGGVLTIRGVSRQRAA